MVHGFVILAVEVTGTSVKTSKGRIRRFLKLVRAIALRSQVPVTLATCVMWGLAPEGPTRDPLAGTRYVEHGAEVVEGGCREVFGGAVVRWFGWFISDPLVQGRC
jgi:hypothetical protein